MLATADRPCFMAEESRIHYQIAQSNRGGEHKWHNRRNCENAHKAQNLLCSNLLTAMYGEGQFSSAGSD